jgi:hypothetical protein
MAPVDHYCKVELQIMKIPAVAAALSVLFLSPILGCSKSVTRSEALTKFKQTQAYTMLSHGVQPDGSFVNLGRKADGSPSVGSDGLMHGDGETLADIVVTGIVQSEVHAAAHFHLVFDLSPSALQTIRAERAKSGLPSEGNNDVCHIDEQSSHAICDSVWTLTRYDDGWRYDDGTLNGALTANPKGN